MHAASADGCSLRWVLRLSCCLQRLDAGRWTPTRTARAVLQFAAPTFKL
jgi:hypothetical protein